MKKHKISRAAIAVLSITTALTFSACEEKQKGRGTMPAEREESPTPTVEAVKPEEDPSPTPYLPSEDEKIPLSEEELEYINAETSIRYNGFFTCSYCCPEMADWDNICYDGAGISTELSKEELDSFLYGRESYTGITAIKETDLKDYCLSTTGTEYSTAIRQLDWQCIESGEELIYVHEHGDINFINVNVTDGYKQGDIWHLFYRIYDTFSAEDRDFEMTARVTDDGKKWNFISNMPYDEPSMSELLHIDFYPEDTDEALDEMIYVTGHPGDEPAWCWANITAEEDDTLVVIDHAADETDTEEELVHYGIFLPGERLYSATLNKGESFAIRVNMAWTPDIHLSASRGSFEAEYWFGEDNWRHNEKEDGTPAGRKIIGFDRDALGCGTGPENVIQFFNMLEGSWLYLDENDKPVGYIHFDGVGNRIVISNFDDRIDAIFNVSNISGNSSIGDGISIECTEEELEAMDLTDIPDITTYLSNTYRIETEQLYNTECLRLIPVENKDDIIHLIMSRYGGEIQSLEFYRFNICAE